MPSLEELRLQSRRNIHVLKECIKAYDLHREKLMNELSGETKFFEKNFPNESSDLDLGWLSLMLGVKK